MRIVRSHYGHEWTRPVPGTTLEDKPHRTGYASFETRILFNPVEAKVIDAWRWLVGYVWGERFVDPILLLRCRLFGKHSRACRGRRGHP